MDKLIEESDYIKQWKLLPKARRERLTKKQMLRMGKESTLAESIQVQIEGPKKKQWINEPVKIFKEPTETKKSKPKQIIVVTRDENNEIVKTIVDKKKRKRLTALKRAI